jgi:hypothetical protein
MVDTKVVHALSSVGRDARLVCSAGQRWQGGDATLDWSRVTCARCLRGQSLDLRVERELDARVLALASQYHYLAYHVYDARGVSSKGFPDWILARAVHPTFRPHGATIAPVLALELKTRTSKTTSEQDSWLYALDGATCLARVLRPLDLPWLEAQLVLGAQS